MGIFGLLLVLLCICYGSLGSTVYFNTSMESYCAAGCSFHDNKIWQNGVPPALNDTVIIQFSIPNLDNFVVINSDFQLAYLGLVNASFRVSNGTFEVSDVLVDASSRLTLEQTSTIKASTLAVNGIITAQNSANIFSLSLLSFFQPLLSVYVGGSLVLADTATLSWLGDAKFEGQYSSSPNSYMFFDTVKLMSGSFNGRLMAIDVVIAENASVVLNGGLFAGYTELSYYSTLIISYSNLQSQVYLNIGSYLGLLSVANATFVAMPPVQSSLEGDGILAIIDSNVYVINSVSGYLGTIYLNGICTVSLQLLNVSEISTGITGDNNITMITQGAVFSQPIIFGQLVVQAPYFYLFGDAIIEFGITADNTSIYLDGTIRTYTGFGFGLTLQNSKFELSGNMTVDYLQVDATSQVVVKAPSWIFGGQVENSGSITFSNSAITLDTGSFFQIDNATISVPLVENQQAFIVVETGVFYVAGYLYYTFNSNPPISSTSFLIATGIYDGTFMRKAIASAESTISRDLSIQYDTKQISIQYSFAISDVPKWVWGVVGAGVFAIVVIIIAVVLKCKSKRHHYKPLM